MEHLADGTAIPESDADWADVFWFAHTYDGYRRLAAGPNELLEVVTTVLRPLEVTGRPPEWAGIDLLRGSLFYMARAVRFRSWHSAEEEAQMRALLARIRAVGSGVELANDADPGDSRERSVRGERDRELDA